MPEEEVTSSLEYIKKRFPDVKFTILPKRILTEDQTRQQHLPDVQSKKESVEGVKWCFIKLKNKIS